MCSERQQFLITTEKLPMVPFQHVSSRFEKRDPIEVPVYDIIGRLKTSYTFQRSNKKVLRYFCYELSSPSVLIYFTHIAKRAILTNPFKFLLQRMY